MLVYSNLLRLTLTLSTAHAHTHAHTPIHMHTHARAHTPEKPAVLRRRGTRGGSLGNEETAVSQMLRTDPFAFFPPLNSVTRDL